MIFHKQGDLLKSNCDVIAHQSNCMGGFGSGIAGQIRSKLIGAYYAFVEDERTPEQKHGTVSFAENGIEHFKMVFNLYGQMNFGGQPGVVYTDYEKLESAVRLMTLVLDSKGYPKSTKIGMPYLMGCGLAGGDWKIVSKMLNKVSEETGYNFYIYEFTP